MSMIIAPDGGTEDDVLTWGPNNQYTWGPPGGTSAGVTGITDGTNTATGTVKFVGSGGAAVSVSGDTVTVEAGSGGGGGSSSGSSLQNLNYVNGASGSVQMADPTASPYYTWNWYVMSGDLTIQAPPLSGGPTVGVTTCSLWVDQPASEDYTVTFASSPPIRWVGGQAPTFPASSSRLWVSLSCDGTDWNGLMVAQSY